MAAHPLCLNSIRRHQPLTLPYAITFLNLILLITTFLRLPPVESTFERHW